MFLSSLFAIILGYLLGSFPTGYLAGLYFAKVDVRKIGSGRTGGTNVLRSAGKTAAIVTIIGDIGKGVLAVAIARLIWGAGDPSIEAMTTALAAIFSIIGHNHSLFLGFKGGAGSMTAAGSLLTLHTPFALMCAVMPFTFLYITRTSSIGSLIGATIILELGLILMWQEYLPWEYLVFCVPYFLMSWNTHRPNIYRLLAGTERRIGQKAEGKA